MAIGLIYSQDIDTHWKQAVKSQVSLYMFYKYLSHFRHSPLCLFIFSKSSSASSPVFTRSSMLEGFGSPVSLGSSAGFGTHINVTLFFPCRAKGIWLFNMMLRRMFPEKKEVKNSKFLRVYWSSILNTIHTRTPKLNHVPNTNAKNGTADWMRNLQVLHNDRT